MMIVDVGDDNDDDELSTGRHISLQHFKLSESSASTLLLNLCHVIPMFF